MSTDGVNPFGNQSSTHSTWPVVLSIYNLPPWLCKKQKFMMFSISISGPKQPGDRIDVYLRPLVDDLKKLWRPSVDVWDEFKREDFRLHGMLFTTINDLPAHSNMSKQSKRMGEACLTAVRKHALCGCRTRRNSCIWGIDAVDIS
jgi:hypothetical protein